MLISEVTQNKQHAAALRVRPWQWVVCIDPWVICSDRDLLNNLSMTIMTKTMSYIVESCPLTKLNGGLSRLHSADEDAVSWLTTYGIWHAYEKKKMTKYIELFVKISFSQVFTANIWSDHVCIKNRVHQHRPFVFHSLHLTSTLTRLKFLRVASVAPLTAWSAKNQPITKVCGCRVNGSKALTRDQSEFGDPVSAVVAPYLWF